MKSKNYDLYLQSFTSDFQIEQLINLICEITAEYLKITEIIQESTK